MTLSFFYFIRKPGKKSTENEKSKPQLPLTFFAETGRIWKEKKDWK
jgi:hypothetical protein